MQPPRFAALTAVVYSKLSNHAKTVYTAIHIKSEELGWCEFIQEEMAFDLHMSRRHLQTAIAELSAARHVIVENQQSINRYVLPWSIPHPSVKSETVTAQPSAQSEKPTAQPHAQPSAQSNGVLNLKELNRKTTTKERPAETVEWTRSALREFPGAARLYGVPDDQIVNRVLALCGADPEAELAGALRTLHSMHAAPSKSWAWFPSVLAQYMSHPERRSA